MSLVERPRNRVAWLSLESLVGVAGGRDLAGRVTKEMMAEINALAQPLKPLTADDVIVRGMYLMNDQPMHEGPGWVRKFDASAVAQAIPMVVGKPVLVNHATDGYDGLPIGRFFRASLEHRQDGSTWMAALFFMLNDDVGQRFANAIDGGIIAENSPTVEFDRVYCSICGETNLKCDHEPGELYEGMKCYVVMTDIADFWEGSLAWAGRQKNTGFYIAAGRDGAGCVNADDHLAALAKQREERVGTAGESAPLSGWEFMKGREVAGGEGSTREDGSPGT